MGIDGRRLDAAEMAARRYFMFVSNAHVVAEIPIGAVGGYFKVSGGHTPMINSSSNFKNFRCK